MKVVAPSFSGMTPLQRRSVIGQAVQGVQLSFLELLTPDEDAEQGIDLKDLDTEDLPFWLEATSDRSDSVAPRFLDADMTAGILRPIVVSFYSIKGGVGRTTSLAHTAHLLADRGLSVVVVDMDLEAPGLAHILGVTEQLRERSASGQSIGVVAALAQLDYDTSSPLDIRPHLLRVSEDKDLYCLPAGHVDRQYIQRLNNLRFEQFYRVEHNPLHVLIDTIGRQLNPDVILIDARTGITAHNAPLLFDISDISIVVFLPTDQTYDPFRLLWQGMLNRHNRRGYTPQFRFVVSLVPPNDNERKEFFGRGLKWAEEAVDEIARRRGDKTSLGLVTEDTITQVFYQENVALAGRVTEDGPVSRGYQEMADWIAAYVPERPEPAKPTSYPKNAVLEDLHFGGGAAEQQEELFEFFVRTRDYAKAIRPETVLIRGRKGTGKTALFRHLSEKPDPSFAPCVITAPTPLQKGREPFLNRAGYEAIDGLLRSANLSWSDFWAAYILIRMSVQSKFPADWRLSSRLESSLGAQAACKSQEQLIDLLKSMFALPNVAVLLTDELQRLDAATASPVFLLFDGLDTGFGAKPEDLQRRSRAVNGLFEFLIDVGMGLEKLCMKIFLRGDIYRGVSVQNKNYLVMRDVNLNWEQADFLRTAISQAWRSRSLRGYVHERLSRPPEGPVETWSEETLLSILHLLVGERMKGGNTTFTRNWVWNRLSDGNNDHSPRYLFQLFETALRAERGSSTIEPYDRSLIRPRFLTEALPQVSESAVEALREEYPELISLMEYLTEQRLSPLALTGEQTTVLPLALEAGLVAKYEEPEAPQQRYAVPDLHLYGLGMTRRGQA